VHVRKAGKLQSPEERATGRSLGKTLRARRRSPSPIPWRERLYQQRCATRIDATYFSGDTQLCDSFIATTAPASSDNFRLCDYPSIATDVPTSSDAMSASDYFPDIIDSNTTKIMYMPVKFITVHVAALLDYGSCISVMSLSLYDKLPVSVKQPLQSCDISVLVANNSECQSFRCYTG
jgi:hypothetical protein